MTARNKWPGLNAFLALSLFLGALIALPPRAEAIHNESPKPIPLVINNWTSQIVLTEILSEIYQRLGYRTLLIPLSTSGQWGALARGNAVVQAEVWEGSMATEYRTFIESGSVIDAGTHRAKTREGWWYPHYVEDLCPGLPDWRALADCAQLFSDPENSPERGVFHDGPWDKPNQQRIKALGLPFTVRRAPNDQALWRELLIAIQNRQPILIHNWTPNWLDAFYPGRFIEFPAYDERCESDPAWGVNPELLFDCGNPREGWLRKVAWRNMPHLWPCAFNVLQNMTFTNEMVAEAAVLVDLKGYTHRQAARRWLGEHPDIWRQWVPDHCTAH